MRTKRGWLTSAVILFFLIPVNILISGANITGFHARRQASTVVIEWFTESEDHVEKFILERSTDNLHWSVIAEIPSKLGTSTTRQSYTFTDQSIFKTGHFSAFYYRVIIVDETGQQTVHGVIASVSGQSGIKHTWGSIKALFR